MTKRVVKNLGTRQVLASGEKLFTLASKKQKRVSFALLREMFLTHNFEGMPLGFHVKLSERLGWMAARGDKQVLAFLNQNANPKNMPDGDIRNGALIGLKKMADLGSKEALDGLIIGTHDPISSNRSYAYSGLATLAEKGLKETLPYLLAGITDSSGLNVSHVKRGLRAFLKTNNPKVKAAIQKIDREGLDEFSYF